MATPLKDRIKTYNDPTSEVWWDGRSNEKAIQRWSQRAHELSDGHRHRGSDGPMELPDTNSRQGPDPHTHRSGDQRAQAKADLNHRMDYPYFEKVRRTT
jgi:hypothetical protein